MIGHLKRWYRRCVLARARNSAREQGEIFFDKYERDGAYHWDFYYGGKEPYYKAVVDAVVEWVPANSRVIDIGCGDGLLAHRMAEAKGCRVTGVDIHPLAVSLARQKNGGRNTFMVGSAYDCGKTAAYDVAVAIEVFEHLAHPERLVDNADRILKSGGIFVVSTPLPRPDRPLSHYHVREFSESEFRKLLESAFTAVETRRVEGDETTVLCRCVKRET